MPLTDKNQLLLAYKKLAGKMHTNPTFGIGNEQIPTFVQLNSQQIFAEAITDNIQESPVVKVTFNVVPISSGQYTYDSDITNETTYIGSRQHCFYLSLKETIGNFIENTAVKDNIKLQIVSDNYGAEYYPKLYYVQDSIRTQIDKNDDKTWIIDYASGVIFVQDNNQLNFPNESISWEVEAYIYTGKYLDQAVLEASQTGGGSVSDDLLIVDIDATGDTDIIEGKVSIVFEDPPGSDPPPDYKAAIAYEEGSLEFYTQDLNTNNIVMTLNGDTVEAKNIKAFGPKSSVQYHNLLGKIGGSDSFVWDETQDTLIVSNIQATSISINGGTTLPAAGNNYEIQFNSSGYLSADSNLYWDPNPAGQGLISGPTYIGEWTTNGSYSALYNKNLTRTQTNYALIQSPDGITKINSANNKHLYFNIADRTKMIITKDGNVGIGSFPSSVSPDTKLQIYGESPFISISNTETTTSGISFRSWGFDVSGTPKTDSAKIIYDSGTKKLLFFNNYGNPALSIEQNGYDIKTDIKTTFTTSNIIVDQIQINSGIAFLNPQTTHFDIQSINLSGFLRTPEIIMGSYGALSDTYIENCGRLYIKCDVGDALNRTGIFLQKRNESSVWNIFHASRYSSGDIDTGLTDSSLYFDFRGISGSNKKIEFQSNGKVVADGGFASTDGDFITVNGEFSGALLNVGTKTLWTSDTRVAIGTSQQSSGSPRARFQIKQSSQTTGGGLLLERSDTTDYWAIFVGDDEQPGPVKNHLSFSFNGGKKGYINPDALGGALNFTGQHRNKSDTINIKEKEKYLGLIVVSDGTYDSMEASNITINEALPKVSLSSKRNQKSVFGVVSDVEDENAETREYTLGNFVSVNKKTVEDTRLVINSLGEGGIWVTNVNGNLENGDYITTCEIPGYGMKQDDDLLHNYSVAKITCDCDFNLESSIYMCEEFEYEGTMHKRAFVGCTYHCG